MLICLASDTLVVIALGNFWIGKVSRPLALRLSTIGTEQSSECRVGKAKRAHGRLAVCVDADVGTALRAFAHPTLAHDERRTKARGVRPHCRASFFDRQSNRQMRR